MSGTPSFFDGKVESSTLPGESNTYSPRIPNNPPPSPTRILHEGDWDHTFGPESPLNGRPKPSRRNWMRRLYVVLRKLMRKRQESAIVKSVKRQAREDVERERKHAVKAQRSAATELGQVRESTSKELAIMQKRIDNRDQKISELQQQMDRRVLALEETIQSRDKSIKSYVDLQIPKLERELQVERQHVEQLEKLLENKLVLTEMLIAINNQKIVDAEAPMNDSQASAMRQLLRGDLGVERQ